MSVDISIIIVNYRSAKFTLSCIESAQNSKLKGLQVEIIIVDNASPNNEIELIAKNSKSNIIIRNIKNVGMGHGNNIGVSHAQGNTIVITNPDICFEPDALRLLHERVQKEDNIGIVGPLLILPNGNVDNSYYRFPRLFTPFIRRLKGLKFIFRNEEARYLMKDIDISGEFEPDWLLGACMGMKLKTFQDLGGFDTRYFLYFEDVDLCRKAKAAGLKVLFYPEARCRHNHLRSSKKPILGFIPINKLTVIHIVSWLKYVKKWGIKNVK